MTNENIDPKSRIEQLERELAEAKEREDYYKNLSKQTGRKRLVETRQLSQLVSQYRDAQQQLAANSEKLEDLVRKRTEELQKTNEQLRQNIQDQKKTREKLEQSVELDHVILEISSDFINQPAYKIDRYIIKSLEKIGRHADAGRVSLFILAENSETILNTHDWKKNPAEDHSVNFHDQYFPTYLEILKQKKDIFITEVNDLQALISDASVKIDKNMFHAIMAIPMMKRGQIYGALFIYCSNSKKTYWSKELVTFIKIISDVLVNALERKVSELALRESEERYRDIVEKAGLAIVLDAEDGSFHYFNKRFAELFGYSEEEMTHCSMTDLIHPEDMDRVMNIHNKRFQNKNVPKRYEFRGIRKNGDDLYLEVEVVSLKMKNQIIATRSYIWDISHRIQAERKVLESEERYRNLVENFLDIVLISDYSGNILYANPAFNKQTGYSIEELLTMDWKMEMFPDDPQRIANLVREFIQSDQQIMPAFENHLLTKNRTIYYHSLIISKIMYANQPALQYIAHNITEQKQAENALKKSAEFERTVSDIMSQFVGTEITNESIQNALQLIGQWSRAGRATIYRILESGLHLTSLYEYCDKGVMPQIEQRQYIAIEFLEEWDQIIQERSIIHIPDTTNLPNSLATEPIIGQSNDIKSFLFLPFRVRDAMYGAISLEDTQMTNRWSDDDIKLLRLSSEIIGNAFERIETEKMLRRSEEQYRTLFESSNDEIYLHGFTSQMQPSYFLNVNTAACQRLGYTKEELLSMTVFDIDTKDQHKKVATNSKQIINLKHHIFETVHVTKDGRQYPVEVSSHQIQIEGKPVVLSIARDITERKRIEEEVQKSQRLESIGVLAGGIAHDFNNLLSIILGNAQLARMMGSQGKDISKFLNNIEEGAAQASTLTRQLLTFSKGGAPIRAVYPLPDLIRNAVQLALSGLDETAVFNFSEDLYDAEVDKGQINQVIHNLILNSDQAMPNGGVIEVSAENVHSDDVKPLRRLNPGYYVRIRIRDHGIGIKESELKKIFDPYYTTKTKGNGLGLTVAYSIIKKHDGLLLLSSTPGEGTTADIYLPAITKKQNPVSMDLPLSESYHGIAFVMDDETLVLEVAEEMLHELGFRVTRAHDGKELLRQYQDAMKAGTVPDIIIMDLTIPAGMGGMETIKKLRQLDPNVKAIVSSGYSNDKTMSHHQQYGFCGVVAKPYTLEDLRRAIASALKG